MKIFIAQQNYHIGNFEANTNKIITAIREARAQGGELIIFPELAVCGYPPDDLLWSDAFIKNCQGAIERICAESQTIGIIIGAPAINPIPTRKNLFNAAYFLYEKSIQAIIHKTLLPVYDVFNEPRYFQPAETVQVIKFKGKTLAVTVCEDIWNFSRSRRYPVSPLEKLRDEHPEIIINISASPFNYLQERNEVISQNVHEYNIPLIYCNTVGAQTHLIFDGTSRAVNKNGQDALVLPAFSEALESIEWNDDGDLMGQTSLNPLPAYSSLKSSDGYIPTRHIDHIYQGLLLGIQDYFQKNGFQKAVVASSGGLDSAVALALVSTALGSENVHALMMPSEFSTRHSITDAEQLSRNLGVQTRLLPINTLFKEHLHTLEPIFQNTPFSLAEENLQARIRGTLAMAVANKTGAILINTSNKSELAMGYGTLYGDLAGGISVLGDCYKTQVYELAHLINKNGEVIPEHILLKPPSAELRPGQKDTDSLPDYPILDQILFAFIEKNQDSKEVVKQGFHPALVKSVAARINRYEYKRNQFCPVLRISPKAFGVGRKIPITAFHED